MFRSVRGSILCVALAVLVVPAGLAGAQTPRFVPPVDAPIRDPYREPSTPYGPGNRGIEYETEPGTWVRASSDGVVAFAGVIAHEQYVSIDHDDGIRTTYSYLATITTDAGERVEQGDVIGTAGDRLHFGARRDGVYFDPASLFGDDGEPAPAPARARLVPILGRPWT